jgi:hypothetical protein
MVVVVVKSGSVNICSPSSSFHYTTASHLYMRYYTASLRNSAEWRKKLFVKKSNECGSDANVNSCQEEKGEKGEKERKNETLALNQKVTTNNENILSVFLDVHKVINTLSTHLEKIQVVERKEKMIDKKKGDIIYQTRDGRVLHAFHSCEQGKIIWEDIVYDDLKAWLAAASIEAPYRCYD